MFKLWNILRFGRRTFKLIELGSVSRTTKGSVNVGLLDGGDPPWNKEWHG